MSNGQAKKSSKFEKLTHTGETSFEFRKIINTLAPTVQFNNN